MQRQSSLKKTQKREMKEMEWLRPLVSSKSWDYCVVWKLGNGSTRIIEWMGCCCGGAEDSQDEGDNHLLKPCRDVVFQHPRRTNACEAIAKLPTSMSSTSGMHGQVLTSGKLRWLSPSSKYSPGEKVGTRVLIPFMGCLIELFAAKHVPKNQKIINFLMGLYNISLEQETMKLHTESNKCLTEQPLQGFMSSYPPSVDYLNGISAQQYLPLGTHHNFDLFFEGSSTGSTPSEDPSSLDSGFDCGSKNFFSLEQSPGGITDNSFFRQDSQMNSNCADLVEEEDQNLKVFRSSEGERHKSKNLIAERNRRNKLKDRIYNLRSLVPIITKMDILSTLGDSISFIIELQKKVKDLQNELKDIEEEENCYSNISNIPNYDLVTSEKTKTEDIEIRQLSCELDSSIDIKQEMEVQVEVNQIGAKKFFLKLFCEQRRGGFARLMQAMNSLGFKVINANVTTYRGMVMNNLILEADNEEVQVQKVKDSLFDLIRSDSKPSF